MKRLIALLAILIGLLSTPTTTSAEGQFNLYLPVVSASTPAETHTFCDWNHADCNTYTFNNHTAEVGKDIWKYGYTFTYVYIDGKQFILHTLNHNLPADLWLTGDGEEFGYVPFQ
jgi:hypothetical protein